MNTTTVSKNFSTSQRIVALGLSDRQRAKALATLSMVDGLVSACFALWKRLTTRQSSVLVHAIAKKQ